MRPLSGIWRHWRPEIEEKTLSEVLGDERKRLREKIVLEPRAKVLLEKIDQEADKSGERARTLCREALGVLKRLSRYDAAYATKLYRLVEENAGFFSELSYDEFGAIGYLALADDRFKQGEYAEAAKRYRHLWTSSDVYIGNRNGRCLFSLRVCLLPDRALEGGTRRLLTISTPNTRGRVSSGRPSVLNTWQPPATTNRRRPDRITRGT